MSQKALLASFDAMAHGAFVDAGLADVGQYVAPGTPPADPVEVRVMVDRAVQQVGEFGNVNAARVEVAYLLADCTPAANGRLTVDGDTFINVSEVDNDGSLSRWAVRRG